MHPITTPTHQDPPRLLRMNEVMARTGKSRAGIYVAIREGRFPRPIRLGARSVAFLESEINTWIERLAAQRNETN